MSAPLVNAAASATGTMKGAFRAALERLSPKQRQYAMLAAILLGGVGMLWLIFAFTDNGAKDKIAKSPSGIPGTVTNIGVMPPGQQRERQRMAEGRARRRRCGSDPRLERDPSP